MSYRSELIQVAAVALAAAQAEDLGSTTMDDLLGRNKMFALLDEVRVEREQQEQKWGAQKHVRSKWLAILAEEVGEAADEIDFTIGSIASKSSRVGRDAQSELENEHK